MYLADSNWIQKPLDNSEHTGKTPWRVDDVQLAQTLGIMILGDRRGLLDVAVDAGYACYAHTLHVHDGAACFEEFAGLAGAGGESGVGDFLVFDDEVGEHAFGGGDFVHGVQVDVAVLFDVDWAAILRSESVGEIGQ